MKLSGSGLIQPNNNNPSEYKLAANLSQFPAQCTLKELANLIVEYCLSQPLGRNTPFNFKVSPMVSGQSTICRVRFHECEIRLGLLLKNPKFLKNLVTSLIPKNSSILFQGTMAKVLAPETEQSEKLWLLIGLLKEFNCQLSGPIAVLRDYSDKLAINHLDEVKFFDEKIILALVNDPQVSVITPGNVLELNLELTADPEVLTQQDAHKKVRDVVLAALRPPMSGFFSHQPSLETRWLRGVAKSLKSPRSQAIKFASSRIRLNQRRRETASSLNAYRNLKSLDIAYNYSQSLQVYPLLKQLKIKASHSLSLSLQFNRLSPASIKKVVEIILANPQLTELTLKLAHNDIGPKGAITLAHPIASNRRLCKLDLDLFHASIQSEGAEAVAGAIRQNPQLKELRLNLAYNQISTQGAKALAVAIAPNSELAIIDIELNLSGASGTDGAAAIKDEGTSALCQAIASKPKLTSLGLGLANNQLSSLAVSALAELISQNTHLANLKLDLRASKLSDSAAAKLALAIQQNSDLSFLQLDLSYTKLSQEGAQLICLSIASLSNLSYFQLNLSSNQLAAQIISSINKIIASNHKLVSLSLHLGNCSIGPQEAKLLAEHLSTNVQLSRLELFLDNSSAIELQTANQIGDVGVSALNTALSTMKCLSQLTINMQANRIPTHAVELLAESIKRHPTLTNADVLTNNDLEDSHHYIKRDQQKFYFGDYLDGDD